ncbi:MAG: glutaredoxin 3 [Pseudanabaenaceae cyanobacterium bins.68]|nr:glutaredoxin 3 [Pseudanabaenaceae cyanobacterium bins.68]
MTKVEIYTWSSCPFCLRAKKLLQQKGVTYIEHKIDGDEQARQAMVNRGSDGKRSVPQIFINDEHVGGCDALYDLEAAGELDRLLG